MRKAKFLGWSLAKRGEFAPLLVKARKQLKPGRIVAIIAEIEGGYEIIDKRGRHYLVYLEEVELMNGRRPNWMLTELKDRKASQRGRKGPKTHSKRK